MAITPSYTHEDLEALASPYDVTVDQVHPNDKFTFNMIGKWVTIRTILGDHETSLRSDYHKRHRYYVLRGVREDYIHPVVRGVLVHAHVKRPTITNHIEEAIQAALHETVRQDLGAMNLRDKSYEKLRIYSDQNGRCYYCEKKITVRESTIDHINPLCRGGLDLPGNWCIACFPCNLAKGSKTIEEYLLLLR